MAGLKIFNLSKSYGDTQAVKDFSCEIDEGEIVVVLGPSGCGKSTLLQMIAGLEKPDLGEIYWNDKPVNNIPPHQRGFGLMFQDYALFPHLNVFDNVAFGLRMSVTTPDKIRERVSEVLTLVGLSGFEKRRVTELSGGEQQRVALARTLAPRPRLVMLDEPLGSVDRTLRERLMFELRQILRQMTQTALYITHDQEEAFALADYILVMRAGKVEQFGKPQEIYHQPATLFIARFLGFNNVFPGEFIQTDGGTYFKTAIGLLPVSGQSIRNHERNQIVLIRPDSIRLHDQGAIVFQGTLIETSFRGSVCKLVVEYKGIHLTFELPSNLKLPALGEAIRLSLDPSEAFLFFTSE